MVKKHFFYSRKKQARKKRTIKATFPRLQVFSLLLGISLFIYAYFIEPNWIEIRQVKITLPHLAPEFNGYRVVQISDIHTDRTMTPQRLDHLFQLVNRQQADLVAITGDFVTRNSQRFIPNLQNSIAQLHPRDQTVAVLGNHDYWADPNVITLSLKQPNISLLKNDIYTIHRGDSTLNIAGIDDILVGKSRLDLVLKKLPEQGATILLAHEPDFADTSAATKRFDLQLSGHSHAGQIRIPFFRPVILPPLSEKYYKGLYQLNGMKLYTNRGIGTTGLHLRFNCRPEITVFTLNAATST
jgi:uncharacterized protein